MKTSTSCPIKTLGSSTFKVKWDKAYLKRFKVAFFLLTEYYLKVFIIRSMFQFYGPLPLVKKRLLKYHGLSLYRHGRRFGTD